MGLTGILCRSKSERARLLDMSRRMRGTEALTLAILAAAYVVCLPLYGTLPAAPLFLSGLAFWIAQSRLSRFRRPELVLGGCWLFAQLMIACAVILATGPSLYLLPLFIFPMLLGSVVFPPRAAAAGVAITVLLMSATALVANPDMLASTPFALIFPATVTVAGSIPAAAVRDLDIHTRQTAVIDPLTGLLGRVALESRAAELTHQATLADQRVSVIVADVDRFKTVNDEHGHAVGDEVLRAIGQRLTAAAGETDPVYRLGGEEFIVLLAGRDAADAITVAEQLRAAVDESPVEGLDVTISLGVADSDGGPFSYEQVFGAADAALYEAKRDGRNRVRSATDGWRSEIIRSSSERRNGNGSEPERRQQLAADPGALLPVPSRNGQGDRWNQWLAEEREESGSWLVEDDVQREHVLDLNRRIRESNRPAYAVTFAAVIGAAFTYGWLTVIPPAMGAVFYNLVEHRLERFRRPEYVLAFLWLVAQAGNAAGLALVHFSSDNPPLIGLVFMVIMVTGTCGVFPRRGAIVGLSFAMLATVLAGLAINSSLALDNPGLLALPVALVAVAGLIGSAAGRSAVEYRGAAVVDRLTGMFNRAALTARSAELSHHSLTTGQAVAVIEADLDRFKEVNDEHGHAVGDYVLQEVAYRIRKHLRAFDSAYRVGGEEFVVLLPGVSLSAANDTAHRICEAIREEPIKKLKVTLSLGVCASDSGEPFDYQRIFERADEALYEAKQDGRDRVCCAGRQVEAAVGI
jgi:diguanylate cyclase (GGDEF)-like protein